LGVTPKKRRKGSDIGDVYKLKAEDKVIFVQVVYIHPKFGDFVTLIPALFNEEETESWREVLYSNYVYSAFLPVFEYERRGRAKWVANAEVPGFARSLPKMREERVKWTDDGLRSDWIIWDGDDRTRVHTLSPEQHAMQLVCIEGLESFIREVLNILAHAMAITAKPEEIHSDALDKQKAVTFFVYFRDKDMAALFNRSFDPPFECSLSEVSDDEWRVIVSLASEPSQSEFLDAEEEVIQKAKQYQGECDGSAFKMPDTHDARNSMTP
jgi:hypothetical protein